MNHHPQGTVPACANANASITKGKAKPSLRPASDVRAKRTSPFSPWPGGPVCTSAASTGSVGESAAPSNRLAAQPRPRKDRPISIMPQMVSGIAMRSRRQVEAQRRQPKGRSRRSPAPINAMMTTASVTRSATPLACSIVGEICRAPVHCKTTPISRQMMGSESGSLRRASGSQATSRMIAPSPNTYTT